jgi:hypothetical protein
MRLCEFGGVAVAFVEQRCYMNIRRIPFGDRRRLPLMRSKPLGNFIPKQPFNLTEFLSQPGKPRGGGNRRFGNANFRPRPKVEEAVAPVVEAPAEE